MIVYPNAKINLGLNIIARRPDGFHEIESCFIPIGLSDTLELALTNGKTEIETEGIDIPGDIRENLCVKAWEIMHKQYQIPSVRIHLKKEIPIGAGLGGGSSDAAFMLKALNTFFKLNLPDNVLTDFASGLGSDCSFFIKNVPAIASGRGEKLHPFEIALGEYRLVLIYPGIHISTAEAYSLVEAMKPQVSIETILSDTPEDWPNRLNNDFEVSVFENYPLIGEIKDKLYSLGAVYASMSGSGSTVYGIFKKRIPQDLPGHFKDCFIWYEK